MLIYETFKNIVGTNIHTVSTHPPHILDDEGNISPSAFIPFCSFCGNPHVVGKMIPQFTVPVCNKFKPTILKDKLCYQLDVNIFKNEVDIKKLMTHGIGFFLDYNEDRQAMDLVPDSGIIDIKDFIPRPKNYHSGNEAIIDIGTLGLQNF